ncbi:MAG: hypothetical protein QOJ07_2907 [Thermoleophilaceae bacterium]|nr:hypothetical protein [Thermoleophilaceae bacterium]
MAYRELTPPAELRSHVACLWAKTGPGGRVLPDGCADIVWTGRELIVAGPATRAVHPATSSEATKLGVRFRVGAAGAALGLPASELLDSSPRLADVWREGAELADRVADAGTPGAGLRLLVDAVARRLGDAAPADPLVRGAVLAVARPDARVAPLAPDIGLGERQLRRRFDAAVGYAPKTLAGVLRLQRFLRLAGARDASLARLAADAGYADQPHLGRECRRLTGLPPRALLSAGAGPAGERLSSA